MIERADRRERRSTLLVGGILLLIGVWNAAAARPFIAIPALGLAGALLVIGAAWPAGARAFFRAWMGLAGALGWINSRVLLSLFYFGVMTPVGWASRLSGRDLLNRRKPGRTSYWLPRTRTRQKPEGFERLF